VCAGLIIDSRKDPVDSGTEASRRGYESDSRACSGWRLADGSVVRCAESTVRRDMYSGSQMSSG